MKKYYAGIGSRETPTDTLRLMERIAVFLESKDFILRSGGADGADKAFEDVIKNDNNKEIYIPWKNFNGSRSYLSHIGRDALQLAKSLHPKWSTLSQASQKIMARNCYQVLGLDLSTPVDFVLCWTSDGKASGGTGQAIRLANKLKIPVYNLYNDSDFTRFKEFSKTL